MQTRVRKLRRRLTWLRETARGIYGQGQYWLARALGRLRQDPLRPLLVDPQVIERTIAIDDAAPPASTGLVSCFSRAIPLPVTAASLQTCSAGRQSRGAM